VRESIKSPAARITSVQVTSHPTVSDNTLTVIMTMSSFI